MTLTIRRLAVLAVVLAAGALNAACIESETCATIVLEPGGSGRWVVLQRDIRSVADTADDRLREEQEFMSKVTSDQHSQAAAFRALGTTDVKTEVLSAEWPFAVQTEARFDNVADVFSRFFQLMDLEGRTTLVRDGDRTTFTAVVHNDSGDEPPTGTNDAGEGKVAADSLFGENGPVFFIRHGRFLSATGFTLSNDGRVARPDAIDDKSPVLTLSLTWTEREAAGKK